MNNPSPIFIPDSNPNSIVCRRLARVIALRAGIPATPGPPNATPEVVSDIVTELGGPTSLSRLVGVVDDLIVQCSSVLNAATRFQNVADELAVFTTAYQSSLEGTLRTISSDDNGPVSGPSVMVECSPFSGDRNKLLRIRVS